MRVAISVPQECWRSGPRQAGGNVDIDVYFDVGVDVGVGVGC